MSAVPSGPLSSTTNIEMFRSDSSSSRTSFSMLAASQYVGRIIPISELTLILPVICEDCINVLPFSESPFSLAYLIYKVYYVSFRFFCFLFDAFYAYSVVGKWVAYSSAYFVGVCAYSVRL